MSKHSYVHLKDSKSIEELALEHRRIQLWTFISFASWGLASLVSPLHWFSHGTGQVVIWLLIFLPMIPAAILLDRKTRRVGIRGALAVFRDELALYNESRALQATLGVVLAYLAVGNMITMFVDTSAHFVLQMLFWVVMVSLTGFNLWFNRSE